MINSLNNLEPILNTICGTNSSTQNQFLQDLTTIHPIRLIKLLDFLSQDSQITEHDILFKKIFTLLNTKALTGHLPLTLARRIALLAQKIQTSVGKERSNELYPKSDRVQLDQIIIDKRLLLSASPVIRKMFSVEMKEKQENKILANLDPSCVKFLKEYLETGRMVISNKELFLASIPKLFNLASVWQMTELLNFLSKFILIEEADFEFYIKIAQDANALELFERCIKLRFENEDVEIKIKDFDSFFIDIKNLHEKAEKELDKICNSLKQLQDDKVISTIKIFKVKANHSTNVSKSQGYVPSWDFETKLTYPQSLKEMITELDLLGCDISIERILQLAKECKNLHSISLPIFYHRGWDHMDLELQQLHKFIVDFKLNCSHFKGFKLIFKDIKCSKLEKPLKKYPELGKRIIALTFLKVEMSDENLLFFTENCSKLETLSASYSRITDEGLLYLSKNCKNIRSLNLSGRKISSQGLITFAEKTPTIEDLSFTQIKLEKRISDEELGRLVKAWPKLKKLYIEGNKIEDQSLITLAESCPNLQVLNLHEASHLTDQGIEALTLGCANMRVFAIKHCENITSKSLEAITQAWSKLTSLGLANCFGFFEKIPANHIFNMADACPKLKYLDLTDCTISQKEQLTKNLPKINIIYERKPSFYV